MKTPVPISYFDKAAGLQTVTFLRLRRNLITVVFL